MNRQPRAFWVLLAGCVVLALWSPRGPTWGRVQTVAAATLAPVSLPAHRLAGWTRSADPLDAASPRTPRVPAEVYAENELLRGVNAHLLGQVRELQQLNEDRAALGTALRPRCDPARVVGLVAGSTDVLQTVGVASAVPGQAVLHYGRSRVGVAGVVEHAAPGVTRVRLISAPGKAVEGRFVTFDDEGKATPLDTDRPLVEGAGGGMCVVKRFRYDDLKAAGVGPGTWVVLDDREWDPSLAFLRLGHVEQIEPLADEPGFARVHVRPAADLRTLREVMVLTR